MIDVNVYLGKWPCRSLPLDEPRRLADKLRERGVSQAWCGSFDALLHEDVGSVNRRLVELCTTYGEGLFKAIGCVNPMLPDWQEDLRRCHENYGMSAVRLHPNYHAYDLASPLAHELLAQIATRGLHLQIAVSMEDERTQHPLLRVSGVDLQPLVALLKSDSELKRLPILLLNAQRSAPASALAELVQAGSVYVDIATQEGIGGVGKLVQSLGPERVVFGSYSPFFYFEAAELKLRESEITGSLAQRITTGNAAQLVSSDR